MENGINLESHEKEIASDDRFAFGDNWRAFLDTINDERIEVAVKSLRDRLQMDSLDGKTFLDMGSGSGLFSLSARKLGAKVYSFDYDPESVACTKMLRERYFPDDPDWEIERGDVLDESYLKRYGKCDIVYSWGVLHHTGNMYKGLDNAGRHVKRGGKLFISIYNQQGLKTRLWTKVKRTYNLLPGGLRWLIIVPSFIVLQMPTAIMDVVHHGNPFYSWNTHQRNRGMSPWHDLVDWVGGYPFETAKPEEIFNFYHAKGFVLESLCTCGGGLGCNEYVFSKQS